MSSYRLTLRRLLELNSGAFVVGLYKRPYVWGQYRPGERDTVAAIMEQLLESEADGSERTLQGITLSRCDEGFEIVDGQQRLIFLYLLLRRLGFGGHFELRLHGRPEAETFLATVDPDTDAAADDDEPVQDIYFFKKTLRTITSVAGGLTADYLLDSVGVVVIVADDGRGAADTFRMMSSAVSPMLAADIIKADMMRLATSPQSPDDDFTKSALRRRYAMFWDSMVHWWARADVREYYGATGFPAELPLVLALHDGGAAPRRLPLTYERFRGAMVCAPYPAHQAAKHFFRRLRSIQKRFEDAYADAGSYNRIRAILLLQSADDGFEFLYRYFAACEIDGAELDRYYRLSFLGMTVERIRRGDSARDAFDRLYASLSQPDVYHTDAKRDAFALLLRLNIDEDIKLGRRFDFSVWNNRSLEHIFSKSRVWHEKGGRFYDGNDNRLSMSRRELQGDRSFMPRSLITARGRRLSEHCIGNLVLLYGQNNASFGNSPFERKKTMFLTPGDPGVFRSRNLLHTVMVFAGARWDHRSIADNYLQTLRNLRAYYGF